MKAVSIKTGKIFHGKVAALMVKIGAAMPQDEVVIVPTPPQEKPTVDNTKAKPVVNQKAKNKAKNKKKR